MVIPLRSTLTSGSPTTRWYHCDCAIPARFVVAEDDFLRKNARPFYEELAKRDHAAEWVDANCSGHCWDKVESGPGARDWLLQHTLCGTEREPVCGEAP